MVITVVFDGVPKGGVVATSAGSLPVVCGPVASLLPAGCGVAAVVVGRGCNPVVITFLLLCGWVVFARGLPLHGRFRYQIEKFSSVATIVSSLGDRIDVKEGCFAGKTKDAGSLFSLGRVVNAMSSSSKAGRLVGVDGIGDERRCIKRGEQISTGKDHRGGWCRGGSRYVEG